MLGLFLQASGTYRLLRTNPRYLVEGKGGISILLGETNQDILNRWGEAYYRDYEFIEKIEYKEESFHGFFYLRKGRVIEIGYYCLENIQPSFSWITALGIKKKN